MFAVPGVRHFTSEGNGRYPDVALDALVRWVKHKVAPKRLDAKTVDEGVKERKAELCKWLERLVFRGDADIAESYDCTS